MNEACGNCKISLSDRSVGVTTDCMNIYACPTIKGTSGRIILHFGTNDMHDQTSAENIAEETTNGQQQ